MKVHLFNHAEPVSSVMIENNEGLSYLKDYEYMVKQSASVCIGKSHKCSTDSKGMGHALASGHLSLLEHLPITWMIEGISRACSHQLVRHRLASYSQSSQRYAKVHTDSEWFVIPESIMSKYLFKYDNIMRSIANLYQEMIDDDIPGEDARFILPNACKTNIIMSMNARSFVEAARKRLCNRAQWEIRELFTRMRDSIIQIYPHVVQLALPNCCSKIGCQEEKPCKQGCYKRISYADS